MRACAASPETQTLAVLSALRLKSSNSDAALEFSDIDGDCFRITLLPRDHSATRRVYAYTDASGIARLFGEAAREWKGWKGSKHWESLEGELRLELKIDRLGHVSLVVRIRSDRGGVDPWQLQAELGLDAGRLEGIARDAEQLWHRGG